MTHSTRKARQLTTVLVMLCMHAMALAQQDPYERRVGEDFIENTVFRFRTKYNRLYVDPEPGEFKTVVSPPIDVPPLIDGILEDPCWKIAGHTKSAFAIMRTKSAARKQTVMYVCHDDENLYMAIVNEEPHLKKLRMLSHHPAGKRHWKTAGMGDCMEMFLELGGVGGTGQIFQFIFNIHPGVTYEGLAPYVPWIETGVKLAGSVGAKRWICELAFPYRGFDAARTGRSSFAYDGPVRRGEIWGLRSIREGPKMGTQGERFVSTWTYNTTISNIIPFPTGIIVFEDRNALQNGRMNEVDPATGNPLHWRLVRRGLHTQAGLVFDGEAGQARLTAHAEEADGSALAIQTIRVLPNVGYKLKAKVKKTEGEGRVTVGVHQPVLEREFKDAGEWQTHEAEFFTEPQQKEVTVFVRVDGGSAAASIDEVAIEQQIYGAPQDAICLTGNSPRIDLNLDKKSLEKVRYTYREPGVDQERFPFRKQWTTGWTNGMADAGGTTGWIPVTKGSITSRDLTHEKVEWSHPRPQGGTLSLYPKGHEILFDLGRDYYLRAVELLPLVNVGNMTVSVKAEDGESFVLTSKLRGAGVLNPPSATLFGRLRRVNSVGRYVKLWFTPNGKYGHGLFFVRIWGEEKGDRTGIRRFRWKQGLVVPEEKYQQFRKLEGPVLMPSPQEVAWGEGEFVVRDGCRVCYLPGGRSETTAKCLVDEIQELFGIRARLVAEAGSATTDDAAGAIVLGEFYTDGLAAKLAQQRRWQLTADKPGIQGYFLSATPGAVLICGYDQAGTFYGVQTLLQLLIRRDETTAGARSVEVRDWPYIPWRFIDVRRPGTPTRGFIRALARLKVNGIFSNRGTGEIAKMCDDYFMFTPASGAGHSSGSPIEMDDDENWHFLGSGPGGRFRVNACPSDHRRYEFYGSRAAATAAGDLSEVNINTDEMDGGGAGGGGGARWNADRQCLTRKMTGDELFTEMVMRAYDLFRLQNLKLSMLDTMLVAGHEAAGGRGSFHDMYKARDLIPGDIHLYGRGGSSEVMLAKTLRGFERITLLQSRMPFLERGKINDAYDAPPGKRVWGVWNTVWGIAGPVDQILTGQFCRGMASVDGGAIIPFMSQAWNPDKPAVHTLEWALKIGNLQQRLGELALERELPSWRDGLRKQFFKIDVRDACNWSHIDPVPGDGKDWLDWGPNNDLRHLPRGDVEFDGIPFHVIDPETNQGRSFVRVACPREENGQALTVRSREIPVGRKAASLIFLRTNVGGGFLPGYRITYDDVGPQGRGGFLTVPLDAMGNGSSGYACYGIPYSPGRPSGAMDAPKASYKAAKHLMTELYSLFFRLAWLGTTGAGDPVKVTMHEWVNPYPERTIKSISVHCPPGRKSGRVEVLFAVTGIARTPRDLALWRDRTKLPRVPWNEVEIEPTDVPVIPSDGHWAEEEEQDPKTWLDAEDREICQVTGFYRDDRRWTNNRNFFKRMDNSCLANGGTIKLAYPQVCKKVALSGMFYWEYHSIKPHYGLTRFRRNDYVVEVSADGKTWQMVGAKEGICGEDGPHVHRLPATPIQYVRVRQSCARYWTPRTDRYSAARGITWLQLYK